MFLGENDDDCCIEAGDYDDDVAKGEVGPPGRTQRGLLSLTDKSSFKFNFGASVCVCLADEQSACCTRTSASTKKKGEGSEENMG